MTTKYEILSKGAPTDAELSDDTIVREFIENTTPDSGLSFSQNSNSSQRAFSQNFSQGSQGSNSGGYTMHAPVWSAEQDLLLLRLRAAGRSIGELARLFHRANDKILDRLVRVLAMGPEMALLHQGANSQAYWSHEDDQKLRRMFVEEKQRDPVKLAAVFKRSPFAIVCRLAGKHNLVRKYTNDEVAQDSSIAWCKTKLEAIRAEGQQQQQSGARRGREDEKKTYGAGEDCAVCMVRTATAALRPCGHVFCSTCILKINDECCMCRQKFKSREEITVATSKALEMIKSSAERRALAARLAEEDAQKRKAREAFEAATAAARR